MEGLVLGDQNGDIGRVTVSGADSTLTCGFALHVGQDGRGEMAITDGAKVVSDFGNVGASRQTSATDPAPNSGGTGFGLVTIGDNNNTATEWRVNLVSSVGIDEPGTIILLKGTFRVGGLLSLGPHGLINGTGTLSMGSLLNNGGIIAPGLSPGVLSVEGNYEQAPDGVLRIEIAGLGDGQFDVLTITGDAALGGTLEVHMLDGFLLHAGDSVDFLIIGGALTGDFARIIFPELAPGFDADLTFVDGKLRLTARNDAVPGDGTTIDLSGSPCGTGLCGAGGAPMLPLMILCTWRGKQRRRRRGKKS